MSPLPENPVYRVNGIEVQPSRARVSKDGAPIDLRPKTLRVLIFLIERHERLVTKEELIQGVWDGAAVSDDVLIRCIAELRKAFDDDPKNPRTIKTYPRFGYGVVAPVEIVGGETPSPGQERTAAPPRRPGWQALAVALVAASSALAAWVRIGNHPPNQPKTIWSEVAWWKLNEARGQTVADASRSRLTGNLARGAEWITGSGGPAVRFNGLKSAAEGNAGTSLPTGNAPRTVTAWFQADENPIDVSALFEYGSDFRGPTNQRLSLIIGTNGRLSFGDSSTGGVVAGARKVTDGSWHLVAGSYSGPETNIAQLYIDGALDGEQKLPVQPNTLSGARWRLGQDLLGGTAFRGAMRDVRVYHRALGEGTVMALYRCAAKTDDMDGYYFLPISHPGIVFDERGSDVSTPFHNEGHDFQGIQLAHSDGVCGWTNLQGANVGQDLRMSVELFLPRDGARITHAGPYFRSRAAAAGDGFVGGESAGYWTRLFSTGMVQVMCANPKSVVAFSPPIDGFDAGVYHRLEIEARGEALRVWLDGKAVTFDQGRTQTEQVKIPPSWEGPPRIGNNDGTAGVAFGIEDYKLAIGGERARNFRVVRLDDKARR